MSIQQEASSFRFPSNIRLRSCPLVEAWLEIRFSPEGIESGGPAQDEGLAFALGRFYDAIRDGFGFYEKLEASRVPEELTPHVPRHRFRPSKDSWPLFQLGPGIATVNFTQPYNWDDFKQKALYLRAQLLKAYSDAALGTERVVLRYRNVTSFNYYTHNLFDFLEENLNTSIALPVGIPGPVSTVDWPIQANLVLSFDLLEPPSKGVVRIGTGRKQSDEGKAGHELVLWQFEIASYNANAPRLQDHSGFEDWLELAHRVIHEWFFSMIEGPLLREYSIQTED
jgi:uncharacterized protein (TIGR04255 family)